MALIRRNEDKLGERSMTSEFMVAELVVSIAMVSGVR